MTATALPTHTGRILATAGAIIARGWYTVTRAAIALGYHRKTILRMLAEGKIDGARKLHEGGHWRIPRAWVDQEVRKGMHAVIRRPPRA